MTDIEEIFQANPGHAQDLQYLESLVRCEFELNEHTGRVDLNVKIDDKTTYSDVKKSWPYIRVMREMLHNFQGRIQQEANIYGEVGRIDCIAMDGSRNALRSV